MDVLPSTSFSTAVAYCFHFQREESDTQSNYHAKRNSHRTSSTLNNSCDVATVNSFDKIVIRERRHLSQQYNEEKVRCKKFETKCLPNRSGCRRGKTLSADLYVTFATVMSLIVYLLWNALAIRKGGKINSLLATISFLLLYRSITTVNCAGVLEFKSFQRLYLMSSPNKEMDLKRFCDINNCQLTICAREFDWQLEDTQAVVAANAIHHTVVEDDWSAEKCRLGYSSAEFVFQKEFSSSLANIDGPAGMMSSFNRGEVFTAAGETALKLNFYAPWEGTFSFNVRICASASRRVIVEKTFVQPQFLQIGRNWTQINANLTVTGRKDGRTQSTGLAPARVELSLRVRANCASNYYGRKCAVRCDADTVEGRFECVPETGQRRCRMGWRGANCEIRAEKCVGVTCAHGECNPDSGKCVCRTGYQGEKCDQCVTYTGCKGKCTRPFECVCPEGRGGPNCDKDMVYCTHNSPCLNGGICANDRNGSYTCSCRLGFTGRNCEKRIDSCDETPCQNGAKCIMSLNKPRGFRCECQLGLYGRYCQSRAISCVDMPCDNDAFCVEQPWNSMAGLTKRHSAGINSIPPFKCHCAKGWSGVLCDTPANWCSPNKCFNGGTCVESANTGSGFSCLCANGFTGSRCERNVDDCEGNPCGNNGVCLDEIGGFQCKCKAGFSGVICQHFVSVLIRDDEINSKEVDEQKHKNAESQQLSGTQSLLSTKFVLWSLLFISVTLLLLVALVWHLRVHLSAKISQNCGPTINASNASDLSLNKNNPSNLSTRHKTNDVDNNKVIKANMNNTGRDVMPMSVNELTNHFGPSSSRRYHPAHHCCEVISPPPSYTASLAATATMSNANNRYNKQFINSSKAQQSNGDSVDNISVVMEDFESVSSNNDKDCDLLSRQRCEESDIASQQQRQKNQREQERRGCLVENTQNYSFADDSVIVDMDKYTNTTTNESTRIARR